LRAAHLDRGNPEAVGWVFFNTDNKWLGGWKAQEEFVLRVPLEGKVFEFPFRLPPEDVAQRDHSLELLILHNAKVAETEFVHEEEALFEALIQSYGAWTDG